MQRWSAGTWGKGIHTLATLGVTLTWVACVGVSDLLGGRHRKALLQLTDTETFRSDQASIKTG